MQINLDQILFQRAMPVLQKIESHGYEAYFVGGCVRDSLLGLSIHDIDIASSAKPEEIETIFSRTVDLGKEHGTIIVMQGDTPYEVTTFRTEGDYSDYRRPDSVSFVRNLKEDTLRRDFTVNAMAVNHHGKVIDYHGGLKDIRRETIRAVSDPQARFNEDPLRMVRAVRFASQLDFDLDEHTYQALKDQAHLLENISIERVRIELTKYLMGPYFYHKYTLLTDSGLSKWMNLPQLGLEEAMEKLGHDMARYCREGKTIKDVWVWSLFCFHLGLDPQESRKLVKEWTFSNQFADDLSTLVELLHKERADLNQLKTVYSYPLDLIKEVTSYYSFQGYLFMPSIDQVYMSLSIHSRQDIALKGQDIIKLLDLSKGGPIVGQIIEDIEDKIIEGSLLNQEKEISKYILDHYS